MSDFERQQTEKASPVSAEVKPLGNTELMVDSLVNGRLSEGPMFNTETMEVILERKNMLEALKRVQRNKGAPGVDGMTTEELPKFLIQNWEKIRNDLLNGGYNPQAVKRVKIPKPGKKEKRNLGIPSVLDRLIQQAILQVLQNKWDRKFSENSFGFRPDRSAHQAVEKAQSYLKEGYEYVVDVDLEKFFDKVNHDRLMGRLFKEIEDKRLLKLIDGYLKSGILEDGTFYKSEEGTPQGGPLSPFLSNIVLDELDKELEKRGLNFVRYADDLNTYVRSKRAAERILKGLTNFIENKMKLKVNKEKSSIGRPGDKKFLGFSFTKGKKAKRRKVAKESVIRFKDKMRRITKRNRSMTLEDRIKLLRPVIIGWRNYFEFAEARSEFQELDCWIRRKLRCIQWKHWKVYKRRKKELLKRGVREDLAQTTSWSSKGPWKICNTPGVRMALPNKYFDSLGLPRLYRI